MSLNSSNAINEAAKLPEETFRLLLNDLADGSSYRCSKVHENSLMTSSNCAFINKGCNNKLSSIGRLVDELRKTANDECLRADEDAGLFILLISSSKALSR